MYLNLKKNEIVKTFLFNGGEVPFGEGETVLDALLKDGYDIDHSCGKMGTCGTCLVTIKSGLDLLPPRNELETALQTDRNLPPNERQSCQIPALENLSLFAQDPPTT